MSHKPSSRILVPALALIALLTVSSHAQDAPAKKDLRLLAKVGTKLEFHYAKASKAVVAEIDYHLERKIAFDFTVVVKKVREDGGREVAITYGAMTGMLKLATDEPIVLDSTKTLEIENPRTAMIVKVLLAPAGRTITATLDSKCNVTAVAGLREAYRAAVGEMADQFPDEEAITEVQTLFVPHPTEPIGVGDKVKRERGMKVTGSKMNWVFTETLADSDAADPTLVAEVAPPPMEGRTGSGKATTTFSAKDGFLIGYDVSFKLTTKTRMTAESEGTLKITRK